MTATWRPELDGDQVAFLRALTRQQFKGNVRGLTRGRVKWGDGFDPSRSVDRLRFMERTYTALGGEVSELHAEVDAGEDRRTLDLVLAAA